ncbi:hypothetical protein [Rummeliibacillus pycnus]|uniref:hypothetical protein n=1 Tax=Rummeliibacillus pycnus TaxID=101070 RepID=UPI003D26C69D
MNTISWEQLTPFFQNVFKIEGVLLILQLLILLFCFLENNFTQKILSVSIVTYAYKMAIDPFVFISYIAMDRGAYENVKFYLAVILLIGLILHCIFLYHWIRKIKRGEYALNTSIKSQSNNSNKKFVLFPIVFAFVIFSFLLIRNIPGSDNIIYLIVAIVLLICLAYAVCEFIFVSYCIFRFPSFAVNPPQKKQQYVNHKNLRKKKKKNKR